LTYIKIDGGQADGPAFRPQHIHKLLCSPGTFAIIEDNALEAGLPCEFVMGEDRDSLGGFSHARSPTLVRGFCTRRGRRVWRLRDDGGGNLDFAERYDPQPFHNDPEAAATGMFGGLIASGWNTVGVVMCPLVDHFIPRNASLGAPGVDELRWLKPVRPGDRLRVRVSVQDCEPSRSKGDRGIVRSLIEALN
jgi:acyl dehydratase